jgi:hypothetical protein
MGWVLNLHTLTWNNIMARFVHTCKRSSDLAKLEGLAISTTFLAFSATRWKGVTKEMVTYHGA